MIGALVAWPLESGTAEPTDVPSTTKVTEPVGVPNRPLTVAVNVTAVPIGDGFIDDVMLSDVLANTVCVRDWVSAGRPEVKMLEVLVYATCMVCVPLDSELIEKVATPPMSGAVNVNGLLLAGSTVKVTVPIGVG